VHESTAGIRGTIFWKLGQQYLDVTQFGCDTFKAVQVNKIILASLLITASGIAFASPPSESLVLSCLRDEASSPSIIVHELSVHEFQEEDDYAEGFNALFFEYKGAMSDMRKAKKLMP
jgi:hypothetical protein